jgi:hypothetical protein
VLSVRHSPNHHSRGPSGRRVVETVIDSPPMSRRNFSPYPSNTDVSRSPVGGLQEPGRARLISGEYFPPGKDGKEDEERIIFC